MSKEEVEVEKEILIFIEHWRNFRRRCDYSGGKLTCLNDKNTSDCNPEWCPIYKGPQAVKDQVEEKDVRCSKCNVSLTILDGVMFCPKCTKVWWLEKEEKLTLTPEAVKQLREAIEKFEDFYNNDMIEEIDEIENPTEWFEKLNEILGEK